MLGKFKDYKRSTHRCIQELTLIINQTSNTLVKHAYHNYKSRSYLILEPIY